MKETAKIKWENAAKNSTNIIATHTPKPTSIGVPSHASIVSIIILVYIIYFFLLFEVEWYQGSVFNLFGNLNVRFCYCKTSSSVLLLPQKGGINRTFLANIGQKSLKAFFSLNVSLYQVKPLSIQR